MKVPSNGCMANPAEGERKSINSELWHACAGPLVSLPPAGSLVVYFPQGHSEQVAASMQKQTDFIPSYPNLPSKLICVLHNVTLHADTETDEVYAQMTLQPVNKYEKEALLASDMGLKQNRQPTEFFCKTLTASDTSTHGGFSVPRRAAEKIFPPLDFSMQPPAQELVARDLHDNSWTFRHIYRGQPKRHLLTTGWSVFVSTKRLLAGDSVLFIRDEKSQLLLGIRHANRQQPAISSSVISSDSMHIGILAAAAHAAANNSPFTVFFNPRASPAEFVVPFSKYNKAMYTQVSLGMRFRMMFETEESGIRRYMGTVTGISDMDSVRWKNSQWRNLQVGWDESAAGERPSRVSIWDIEPVVTPFYICPPPFFRPKFPKQPGMPGHKLTPDADVAHEPFDFPNFKVLRHIDIREDDSEIENAFRRVMPWLGDEFGMKDPPSSIFPGLSLVQWMSMQQNNQLPTAQAGIFPPMYNNFGTDDPSKLLNFQTPGLQFNKSNSQNQPSQLAQPSMAWTQQQQLQQMLQANTNQQLTQQQQPQSQAQQIRQKSPNLQQQQQIFQPTHVNNGLVSPDQIPNQNLQQPSMYAQLQQQQQLLANNTASKGSSRMTSLPQETQFQQQMEQQSRQQQQQNSSQRTQQQTQLQQNLSPRTQQQTQLQQNLSHRTQMQPQAQQFPQANLSEQQLHLQMLQKLQQQQQLLSSASSQLLQQQQSHQQNPLLPQSSLLLSQQQSSNGLLTPQSLPINQSHGLQKSPATVRHHSAHTEGEAPSCSTSPSTNNCQAPALMTGNSTVEPANNLIPEHNRTSDLRIRQDFHGSKGLEQLKYKGAVTDQMEASSGMSYSLDTTNIQQNFALPPFDSLAPDTLLSQGYDSQKDFQHLLNNYGCSNDVAVNDSGALNGGLWANQAQRMRTYTKVQKRGSVGRSIDVTRYKGYDELRLDLARMFGIEGQLEDPQSSEWKLVYVDHENDILLVGDDPWEEFISCVQSIKILSSAEVQQMSLDGDLAAVPALNQACSGSDSGNAWRGQYDDNSAASFNR